MPLSCIAYPDQVPVWSQLKLSIPPEPVIVSPSSRLTLMSAILEEVFGVPTKSSATPLGSIYHNSPLGSDLKILGEANVIFL